MRPIFVLLALTALLAAPVAQAVPLAFTHQARLLDSAGNPLVATHPVVFALYADANGGPALWTEAAAVQFDNGLMSHVLGSVTPLSADDFNGSTLYLGLAVDGEAELTPRVPLVSVPYAVRAASANTTTHVDGGVVDASEIRVNGTVVIDGDGLLNVAVSFLDLTDVPPELTNGDADRLAALGCTEGQIPRFAGTDWACAAANAHAHDASDLTGGTLSIDRIPVGTSAGTVAAGDHAHSFSEITGELSLDRTTGSLPASRLPPDQDALGALACPNGQIAKRVSGAWACADDNTGTPVDVIATLGAASGSVGVGRTSPAAKLDVNGGVRIGAHGVCNTTSAGALQYTESTGLQLCDGTDWQTLRASGAFGSQTNPALSCKQLLDRGFTDSGLAWVDPDGSGAHPAQQVWCDQETDGGGWTVLQYDAASQQQSNAYGVVGATPGWSLDYQNSTSFWANVPVTDFYMEVEGAYKPIWRDVRFTSNSQRPTPKWLFSGGQSVNWGCNSDSPDGTCHLIDGTGRRWGQWLNTSGCCLGTKGIWYYSYNSARTYNYGLCQTGYPKGDLGTRNVNGCQVNEYTSYSPAGSVRFKYAIRY